MSNTIRMKYRRCMISLLGLILLLSFFTQQSEQLSSINNVVDIDRIDFLKTTILQVGIPTMLSSPAPAESSQLLISSTSSSDVTTTMSQMRQQSIYFRTLISQQVQEDPTLAGQFIRLAFHDAATLEISPRYLFRISNIDNKDDIPNTNQHNYNPSPHHHWTGGPNGSIQYELNDRYENRGLRRPLEIVQRLRDEIKLISQDGTTLQLLSLADCIALAGAAAVEASGGPQIRIRLGRKDTTQADSKMRRIILRKSTDRSVVSTTLPSAGLDSDGLRLYFSSIHHLSDAEWIALCGSHGLGRHVSLLNMTKECLRRNYQVISPESLACLETAPVSLPFETDQQSSTSVIQGSNIFLGQVPSQLDYEGPVQYYTLLSSQIVDDTSVREISLPYSDWAVVLQHDDSDDGSVITELTITTSGNELRSSGVNILIWSIGQPSSLESTTTTTTTESSAIVSPQALMGIILIDFDTIHQQVLAGVTGGTGTSSTSTTATTTDTDTPAGTSDSNTNVSTDNNEATETNTNNNQQQPQQSNTVVDTRPNVAPVVTGDCTLSSSSSPLLQSSSNDDNGMTTMSEGQVALTPTTTFSYQLITTTTNSGDQQQQPQQKIRLALQHTSNRPVWLGLASSPNGYMVGSDAVIGVPLEQDSAASSTTQPRAYRLLGKDVNSIQQDPTIILEDATLESRSHNDNTYITTLSYTKTINDPLDHVPIVGSAYDTFLYAVGEGHTLAYHEHRGQFQIDLSRCGGSGGGSVDGTEAPWTKSGLFAFHGFIASLAWALLTPFAMTVAWFRTLVPSSWIYIHVFSNVLSVLLTAVAFLVALIGVGQQQQQGNGTHFSRAHHWIGTFLLIFASYQVTNGFLRPSVERKDASSSTTTSSTSQPQELLFDMIPIPRSPREMWHALHQMTGLLVLAMGMYQIASGLNLYSMRYQTTSITHFYWIYVGLFVLSLIGLKVYVLREEDKARQGVLQAVSTTDPEEEEQQGGVNVPQIVPTLTSSVSSSSLASTPYDIPGRGVP